ncbi:MAG TPA: peroxidase-related enzyme [Streptosporangiaceae bacterium]|nr:peroxidase-related enzyme [Streptosporangiaceae bacterium]
MTGSPVTGNGATGNAAVEDAAAASPAVGNGATGSAVVESRFGMTELDDLPDDLRQRIGVIAAKSGFVPNIFRALGHRPAELRAFLDYHDALMDPPAQPDASAGGDSGSGSSSLSKAERELVVVATSAANHCLYCIVAHGAILRIRSKDPQLADRVAANPWQAELTDRSRAIVNLALALTRTPELFGDADIAKARDAGLTDDEIWDVGAITALFAASNRLAHLTALQPNPEFYLMGRTPRT